MGVKFQDYYETLEVKRNATPEQIKSAYRKMTRKYHPDLNREPGAEQKFRRINEAYEVLKDPEKRKKYDELGENWKSGQDFRPPPGWENMHFDFGGRVPGAGAPGSGGFSFSPGGFSDFFEMFFGRDGGPQDAFNERRRGERRTRGAKDGRPTEVEIEITLEDAYHGVTKNIEVRWNEVSRTGLYEPRNTRLEVKIPPGTADGSRIRIRGEGPLVGTARSDLFLKINLKKHSTFDVTGHDMKTQLRVSPWEAALGAKLPLKTLDGEITLSIPPGSQTGQKLRLRDKGLPKRGDERGDLLVELNIVVPKELTDKERDFFQQLSDESEFNPRD